VIGSALQAEELVRKLQSHRELGLSIVGVYSTEDPPSREPRAGVPVLSSRQEAVDLVESGNIDQVFIALALEESGKLREIRDLLGDGPVAVHFVPDLAGLSPVRGRVEQFDGLNIISLQDTRLYGWNSLFKRLMDLFIGGLALALFSPFMALVALGIRLTSPGPVFVRQERMGLDGKRFQMFKFRTMVEDAEQPTGPLWASPNDPRVTPFGRFLRCASLDELPQLLNVLKGEMSLVGPRPERPSFVEEFRAKIPRYMLRHGVKAGMTGWAQVNGWRGNTSLEKRIEHDIYYIENWSLWLDVKILALTLFRGFLNKNAY
jgi:Undecaprenyl-phosphate glucose phosphotransferase